MVIIFYVNPLQEDLWITQQVWHIFEVENSTHQMAVKKLNFREGGVDSIIQVFIWSTHRCKEPRKELNSLN